MTPIKDIIGLHPEIKKLEQKQSQRVDSRKEADKASQASSVAPKSGKIKDQVSISKEAQTLLGQKSSLKSYVDEIDKLPTLSDEKLSGIRTNIKNGAYNRDEVYNEISRAISAHSGVTGQSGQVDPDSTKDISGISDQVQSGYYGSDEVINTIVDRLLNSGDL